MIINVDVQCIFDQFPFCRFFLIISPCLLVDVNDAGEGNMEISITGGGRNIQNHVRQIGPGQFEVSYTPMDEGPHIISCTFNGEHVAGIWFGFASRRNAKPENTKNKSNITFK